MLTLASIAALAASLALTAISLALGLPDRARGRRLAWTCAASAVGLCFSGAATYLWSMTRVFGAVAGVDPSRKAVALSLGIPEAMNALTFFALAALPLAVAAIVLLARASGPRTRA
jgi:hypothetical protein